MDGPLKRVKLPRTSRLKDNYLDIETASSDALSSEIVDTVSRVNAYKRFYLMVAVYFTSYRILLQPLQEVFYATIRASGVGSSFKMELTTFAVFFLPWFFQPFMAYVGEIYYPFRYRIKGYALIISVLNAVLAVPCLFFKSLPYDLFYCMFVVCSLIMLDTVAQGMVSLVSIFHKRLENLSETHNTQATKSNYEPSESGSQKRARAMLEMPKLGNELVMDEFFTYFSYFSMSRSIWLYLDIVAYCYLFPMNPAETVPDVQNSYFKGSVLFIVILSSVFFILSLLFQELKMINWKRLSSERVSYVQFLKRSFSRREILMVLVMAGLNLNPSNYSFKGRFLQSRYLMELWNEDILAPWLVSLPILFSGLYQLLFINFSLRLRQSIRTFVTVALLFFFQIFNNLAIFMYSCADKNNGLGSTAMLFVYNIISFMTEQMVVTTTILSLIEKFISKTTEKTALFVINFLTSCVFVFRGLGRLLTTTEDIEYKWSKSNKNYSGGILLNTVWIGVCFAGYFFYNATSEKSPEAPDDSLTGHFNSSQEQNPV